MNIKTKIYSLLFFLILLETLDITTTTIGLQHGAKEANPLYNSQFFYGKPISLFVLVFLYLYLISKNLFLKPILIILTILNIFFIVIVSNNVVVIWRILNI